MYKIAACWEGKMVSVGVYGQKLRDIQPNIINKAQWHNGPNTIRDFWQFNYFDGLVWKSKKSIQSLRLRRYEAGTRRYIPGRAATFDHLGRAKKTPFCCFPRISDNTGLVHGYALRHYQSPVMNYVGVHLTKSTVG